MDHKSRTTHTAVSVKTAPAEMTRASRAPHPLPNGQPSGVASATSERRGHDDASVEATLGQIPPRVGALLVAVGVVGILIPGPPGSPLFIAGCMVLAPTIPGFGKIEQRVRKRYPSVHRAALECSRFVVKVRERFLRDLAKRYPAP